jgi:hypothetical protein
MHKLLLRCLIVVTWSLASGVCAYAQDHYPTRPVRLVGV